MWLQQKIINKSLNNIQNKENKEGGKVNNMKEKKGVEEKAQWEEEDNYWEKMNTQHLWVKKLKIVNKIWSLQEIWTKKRFI